MTRSPTPTDSTETLFLKTASHPPEWHWGLDGRSFQVGAPALDGKPPGAARGPAPKPRRRKGGLLGMGVQHQSFSAIAADVHVEHARCRVLGWRGRGCPGSTPAALSRVGHWSQPERRGLTPCLSRRDALETAAHLAEAGDERQEGFSLKLSEINAERNNGIPPVGLKVTTGAGKAPTETAMLIPWQAKGGGCRDFLLPAPDLTIRDRLVELPGDSGMCGHLHSAADMTGFGSARPTFKHGGGAPGMESMEKSQRRRIGPPAAPWSVAAAGAIMVRHWSEPDFEPRAPTANQNAEPHG